MLFGFKDLKLRKIFNVKNCYTEIHRGAHRAPESGVRHQVSGVRYKE